MIKQVDVIDSIRMEVGRKLNSKRKSELGQFMTPGSVAQFMAGLFSDKGEDKDPSHLLDAGAGIGSLSCALFENRLHENSGSRRISLSAFEIDPLLSEHLEANLSTYKVKMGLSYEIYRSDFIEEAVDYLLEGRGPRFTHAILNPPYKKINSASKHRSLLRSVGIEATNLYSAFTALSLLLMKSGGEMVAIIPRSFCNGPYFKQFRTLILKNAAIRRIHLFQARDKAFQSDDVLQENVILVLEKNAKQDRVLVSTSNDGTFSDYAEKFYPFSEIVKPGDVERFIRIPSAKMQESVGFLKKFRTLLPELSLAVSTGPIVDFRMTEHLRKMPVSGSVPLLYPTHFADKALTWPKPNEKKPNALMQNDETQRWLFPNGHYVVTKRFSAKEEHRRVVANVVEPSAFDSEFLAFENHLNVFHHAKRPIAKSLAHGLALYLNSSFVDEYFRSFNGHTQVNATDLRSLRYPSKEQLLILGRQASSKESLSHEDIDGLLMDLK